MKIFKATAISMIALMAAMPAMAQTANSNSDSTSGAASSSRSSSGSRSSASTGASTSATTSNQQQGVASTTNTGVTLNQNSTSPANTSTNNTSRDTVSGGTNNSNTQSGYTTSDNIVRTTPTVYAPPVSGGNPCTLAVSGGVSVIGWGAAAGGTFVDQDCANRQKIAMVWNSGLKDIAFELMCNDRDTYNAAKAVAAGPRCAFRQQFEAPGAQPAYQPMVQNMQPTPVGLPTPPASVVSQPIKDRTNLPRCSRTVTDNCYAG